MQPIEVEILYSPKDIAKRFGVTTRTVLSWRKRGLIEEPAKIFGGRCPRWTPEQVQKIGETTRNEANAI